MAGTWVLVRALPTCDFGTEPAKYDGATSIGPWANMCEAHFRQYGLGLGVGRGQRLVVGGEPVTERKSA